MLENMAGAGYLSHAGVMGGKRGPGRPKGSSNIIPMVTRREIADKFRAHADKAIKFYIDCLEDTTKPDKIRMDAADRIMDRGYGKPVSSVEMTGAEGEPLIPQGAGSALSSMSGEELAALGTVLKAMITRQPGDDAEEVEVIEG